MPEPGTESGSAGDGSSEPSTPDSAPVPADPAPGSTGDAGSGADSGGGDDSTPDSSGSDGGSGDGGADSSPDGGGADEAPAPDGGAGSTPDSSDSLSDGKDAGGSQSGDNPMADVIVDRLDSASDRLNQLQSELNSTLRGVSRATGAVVGDLAGLCAQLDELVDLIDDAEDLSAALRQSSGKIRSILDGVAALQLVLNEYEPTLQESVASVGALSTAAVSTLRDLETLLGVRPLRLYARELFVRAGAVASRQWEHARIGALYELCQGRGRVLVATAEGLLQKTCPPRRLEQSALLLEAGERYDLGDLPRRLVEAGYTRADQVEGVGQFALRGGILDVFSPLMDEPVRCEFFDDEIDSLGSFDTATQRRTKNLTSALLLPASELPEGVEPASLGLNIVIDEQRGQLHTLIARGSQEEIMAKVGAVNPVFMEFLPLTLEEFFIMETEVAGYDLKKLFI